MRVLTITQPWATLIALGAKSIETRSWRDRYRGPLAIRAGRTMRRDVLGTSVGGLRGLEELCGTDPFFEALHARGGGFTGSVSVAPARLGEGWSTVRVLYAAQVPLGAVVAVANLVDVIPTDADEHDSFERFEALQEAIDRGYEGAFGDFNPGRYAWMLDDVQRLRVPVKCDGGLGLRHASPELVKAIEEARA